MSSPVAVSSLLVDQLRKIPTHDVIVELTSAARDAKILATRDFKKLLAYLLELADGRDRREPWTTRPGDARPIPRLRVAMETCFGVYADLHWFNLNKTTNRSGKPLLGLFPRMAASLGRVQPEDFAAVALALLSPTPDAALLRVLQARGGKVRGMGVELFSRLALAYRRDLYFVIPRDWGEASGCLRYIGDDLRKYCALCRNLRSVCDDLDLPAEIRASLVEHFLRQPRPPAPLLEALHKAIGPSVARFSALEPGAAHVVKSGEEDEIALPVEFAARAIRGRRGGKELRDALLKVCGDRCAMTGKCVRDLLEVAYVVPYPTAEGPATDSALLMRSDIHTLWDLNLLGIEASTGRVYVSTRLGGTVYEKLAGRTLQARRDGSRIAPETLRERWAMFVSAHPRATSAETTPSPGGAPAREETIPDRGATSDPPEVVTRPRTTFHTS